MQRKNGRQRDQVRDVKIIRHFTKYAEGSVLIEVGDTRVICNASVQDGVVPPFLKDTGCGWVTAEYSMLPRSTPIRDAREAVRGQLRGRTQEIQRLIGRSLRSVTDLKRLGERTIILDCDVIQADGGTRTASITGAYVALVDAFHWLKERGLIESIPLTDSVAAISVGVVDGVILLDLDAAEDSRAQVDMNVVMTGKGEFVEVQGSAERIPFTKDAMEEMIALAIKGIQQLSLIQKEVLEG